MARCWSARKKTTSTCSASPASRNDGIAFWSQAVDSPRALKDLIDHIGSTARDEPVRIFAMTDGDLHGPMIFQTLVKETKARAARAIEVVNLGLFPWEALADGLPHETGLREITSEKAEPAMSAVRKWLTTFGSATDKTD